MSRGYAIVTGASTGIGKGLARRLCEAGYDVLLNYRASREAAKANAEEFSMEYGVKVMTYQADVTDYSQVEAMRNFARENFGEKLEILCCNAGGSQPKPLVDNSVEVLTREGRTNLHGVLYCVHVFAPLMIAQNWGRIIITASNSGFKGSDNNTVYCGAKAGVLAFNRCLAYELGKYNITCNCICPGFTINETAKRVMGDEFIKAVGMASPVGRICYAADMEKTMMYFIESPAITGQAILANAGTHML